MVLYVLVRWDDWGKPGKWIIVDAELYPDPTLVAGVKVAAEYRNPTWKYDIAEVHIPDEVA